MAVRIPSYPLADGSVLVPTTATVLRFARVGLLPGVLPTRGGAMWEIQGDSIRVFSESCVDREDDTRQAIDYLWAFRRKFGRRTISFQLQLDISEHRSAWRDARREQEDRLAADRAEMYRRNLSLQKAA